MVELFYFVFGLFMGSFLHVIAYRGPKGTYFTKSRSGCPHCEHELRWFELIPLVSYGIQFGKCLNCSKKISGVYPASEVICGLLFLFSYQTFGHTLNLFFALMFVSVLFVLSVCDYYYYLLPNVGISWLIFVVIAWTVYENRVFAQEAFFTLLFSIFFIGLLIYLTNGGMGMGDFKLLAVLAFFFGFYHYLQLLFLSSLFAIVYFTLLKFTRSKSPDYIYFGPFIASAACILLFV